MLVYVNLKNCTLMGLYMIEFVAWFVLPSRRNCPERFHCRPSYIRTWSKTWLKMSLENAFKLSSIHDLHNHSTETQENYGDLWPLTPDLTLRQSMLGVSDYTIYAFTVTVVTEVQPRPLHFLHLMLTKRIVENRPGNEATQLTRVFKLQVSLHAQRQW